MDQHKVDLNGIKAVETKDEISEFLKFPYAHYSDSKHWVAPLYIEEKKLIDTKKNPYFNDADISLFTAEKNGKVAGRIAAIENRAYNSYNKTNVGFFGFFECIEDESIAKLLFRIVDDWCKKRGLDGVMGPFNPGIMDTLGILIEGFDHDPSILMPYNKPYYDDLITKSGYKKEIDLLAFRVTKESVDKDRMLRAEEIVRRRLPGLKVRKVNLKNFDEEIRIIRDLFNSAWADNWGFYPIAEGIFRKIGKDLKTIVDTDMAHVAEVDGKPVAFSVALPDFNQALKKINGRLLPTGIFKLLYYSRKIDRIRTALMGVDPEFQGRGIDAVLHKEAIVNGLEKGYVSSELGWVLEDNTSMIRVAERIGGEVEKRYRIYRKDFS